MSHPGSSDVPSPATPADLPGPVPGADGVRRVRAAGHRVALAVVAALGVVALMCVGFVLWLVAAVSGGLDDAFGGGGPDPGDPQVTAAQRAATGPLTTGTRRLARTVALPALPAGTAVVGAGEARPPCEEGQHNFKIDDDFDLSCRMSRLTVIGVPSPGVPTSPVQIVGATPGTPVVPFGEPFPAQMAALDAALQADGWQPQPATSSVTGVVDDYWVKLAGQPRGTLGDRMYSAGDLPSASYAKTVPAATTSGGKREVTLEVSWIDAGSQDTALAGYGGWTTLTRHGATASARDVLAAVPAGGYGVVLTESVEYFRA